MFSQPIIHFLFLQKRLQDYRIFKLYFTAIITWVKTETFHYIIYISINISNPFDLSKYLVFNNK